MLRKLHSFDIVCSWVKNIGVIYFQVRAANAERNANSASLSAANSLLSLGNSNSSSSNSTVNSTNQVPNQAQSLEQLLERQWEQGSQFLMEQAQHFDSEYIM